MYEFRPAMERGRQVLGDGGKNRGEVCFNIFSRKADHTVSRRFEQALPFLIMFALCIVDAAIYFDDKSLPRSAEVGHESADHELPPKLDAVQLPIPQHIPQYCLRLCRRLSELTRLFDEFPFQQPLFLPLSIAVRLQKTRVPFGDGEGAGD